MIERKNRHWSSLLGPLLQPTECNSSQKGLSGDKHKKMMTAMISFRKHQITDEARRLIPTQSLERLDAFLMLQAKILMPYIEEFYPEGLSDYPEVVTALNGGNKTSKKVNQPNSGLVLSFIDSSI